MNTHTHTHAVPYGRRERVEPTAEGNERSGCVRSRGPSLGTGAAGALGHYSGGAYARTAAPRRLFACMQGWGVCVRRWMDAQVKKQLSVGVGGLAGSTILLLTVPWYAHTAHAAHAHITRARAHGARGNLGACRSSPAASPSMPTARPRASQRPTPCCARVRCGLRVRRCARVVHSGPRAYLRNPRKPRVRVRERGGTHCPTGESARGPATRVRARRRASGVRARARALCEGSGWSRGILRAQVQIRPEAVASKLARPVQDGRAGPPARPPAHVRGGGDGGVCSATRSARLGSSCSARSCRTC
jgi:hypothetical protein